MASPGRPLADSPVPGGLIDWFSAGADALEAQFRAASPEESVWTWSADHTAGFWQRMQAIEAAVHRWDAERALGAARPLAADLAADAIGQTFERMLPMRRAITHAPPGTGERYLFRRTDGPGEWALCFDGETARIAEQAQSPDSNWPAPRRIWRSSSGTGRTPVSSMSAATTRCWTATSYWFRPYSRPPAAYRPPAAPTGSCRSGIGSHGSWMRLIRGVEIMKSAVARLQATGIVQTTATRRPSRSRSSRPG